MEEVARTGKTGEAKAEIAIALNHPMILQFEGRDHPVERIDFRLHLVKAIGQVQYSLCRLNAIEGGSTELQLGEVVVAGKRIRLMMPNGLNSEKLVVPL